MFFQDGEQHKLTMSSQIIAYALVAQALGVVVAACVAVWMLFKIRNLATSFEEKTAPVISKIDVLVAKTDSLVTELTPKIATITANAEQVSYTVREKVDELSVTVNELNKTVKEVNLRTRAHVGRLDGMVTEALVASEEISRTVQQSIKQPVRQIAGLVAGVKAAVETLIARSPFGRKSDPGPYDL